MTKGKLSIRIVASDILTKMIFCRLRVELTVLKCRLKRKTHACCEELSRKREQVDF